MRNLSNFPEGIKEYEIIIDQIPINVCLKRYFKSKDLLLFFHGLGCSSEIFDNALTHPSLAQQSLLLIDFPGFGKSGKPDNFSYTMEDQAKVCEKLLELFPRVDLHIIAHSMGGAVPLYFSDKTFGRVNSFANLEGNLTSADCGIFSRDIIQMSLEDYKNEGFDKQKEKFDGVRELKFDETTPLAMYRSAISLVELSDNGTLIEKFNLLNCRKVYFYGEKSREEKTINALDNIEKFMVPNAGHSMMLDNPDDFYNKLSKFIFN